MSTALQLTAAEQALGLALPNRRVEEWKWTDLRRLLDKSYAPSNENAPAGTAERLVATSPFAKLGLQRIVVVNGRVDAAQSKLQGLNITPGAPATDVDDTLLAINARLPVTANTLHFSGNMDQPVEVLHVTSGQGAAFGSRLHVEVADGASATLVETFVGSGDYVNNPVTTIRIGRGARLDRVKVESESAQARHLAHVIVDMAADAHFNDFTLTSGALLSRQNGDLRFNGSNGNARVAGSYLLAGKQHADTRLVVDHTVPECTSRELFKCVMGDEARGIFQGKVIVRPDAQKTDGKQSSHALLLSEAAEFDAKPELEIYADDVVCGHGATCGDLNHDHLFYLRSRGIPEAQARAMLVHAFVAEAMDSVENESLRDALLALAETRMM